MTSYLGPAPDLSRPETAELYDELPLWSALAGGLILDEVPLNPGARVLDVGCGTGFPLIELAQRLGPSARVAGVDQWAAALERARRKAAWYGLANLDIREGDARSLPFADGSFDLVVSNLGLNNFADPAASLRECRRVLAENGVLALATNLKGHMREFYETFEQCLRERGLSDALLRLEGHVEHRATVPGLRHLLGGTGFRVTRVVETEKILRFLDGAALFNHYFIRLGFLPAWRRVIGPAKEKEIFAALEAELARRAAASDGLRLSVPFAYVEAARQ